MPVIVPARLAFTADGTPWSEGYGDVYHSSDGGLEQARHVFLAGNALPARWRGREQFVVLETGFGLGLNFLATWQAWQTDPQRSARLQFVSVEKHPFGCADLATLHRHWPELAALAAQLQSAWPPLAAGFHRLRLDGGHVTLTLMLGDALDMLNRLTADADAIYLDGFAPAKNPELWSPELMRALTRHAAPDATLATWSVAAAVRDTLTEAGWHIEKRPGFAAKRDMLTGQRPGPSVIKKPAHERSAIVIGAGIAGASCAASLASRGWQVSLIERHDAPAQEASGNPAGVLLPMLAKDAVNTQARLSRASYFYALRLLHELARSDNSPLRWAPCGVVQIARDTEHEAEQTELLARLGLPAEYVTFLEREAISQMLGRPVERGGWHFANGGWISPPTLCQALIAAGGDRITSHFGHEVGSLRWLAGVWHASDAHGRSLATASHVVLANADAARRLVPDAELPFTRVRGQVSYLPGTRLSELRMVVCRDGYVTPPAPVGRGNESLCCLGASFDFGDEDSTPNEIGHRGNIEKLEHMLPGASDGIDVTGLEGRVGFRTTTPDRLPLVGSLPTADRCRAQDRLETLERTQGLHCLLGYGARGMVWAPLAAELLSAQLEGEPLPVERDIVAAVDPARFLLRAIRRGRR
jgi:tRNA 5-methylaminomethyl-2-thiouridine biosynthesis bifunctional protein